MKNTLRSFVCAGLVGLLSGAVAQADLTIPPDTGTKVQNLKITQGTPIVFPVQLTRYGVTAGEVRLFLDVDANGRLVDKLVVAYTHREFADAVTAAVGNWQFVPAMVEGRTIATTADVIVRFETTGVVVVERDAVEAPPIAMRDYAFRAREVSELDHAPKALKTPSPVNPAAVGEAAIVGRVRIDFFIDENGHTRMPVVVATDDERLGWAALVAIEQWRFEKPLRAGRPVLTRATQVFTFEPATK